MATYKEIRGTQIEAVSSDPSNPVEGQVWYNTTSNALKGQAATAAGAWATGGSLNTARAGLSSCGGTQDSALVAGGEPFTANTEEYNGTSWTEVNNLNTARRNASTVGTNTEAALCFAGNTPPNTSVAINESWNGSSWTEVADLNAAGRARIGSGTQPAAICFGGSVPGGSDVLDTETWNGSAWTEVNNLNSPHYYAAGTTYGTTTATLCFGGQTTLATTESWNGTNWTEVNDLNTGRRVLMGAGTQPSGIAFGGYDGSAATGKTELWNGSNWTETTDMATARYEGGGAGATNSLAIAMGGPPGTSATEEWTGAGTGVTRTFTDS